MEVDVHARHEPAEYLSRVERPEPPPPGAAPFQQDLSGQLVLVERFGTVAQVLPVSQAQPYLPAARPRAEATRPANERHFDRCARHPGRLLTFAAQAGSLLHVDASPEAIARVADQPTARELVGAASRLEGSR